MFFFLLKILLNDKNILKNIFLRFSTQFSTIAIKPQILECEKFQLKEFKVYKPNMARYKISKASLWIIISYNLPTQSFLILFYKF